MGKMQFNEPGDAPGLPPRLLAALRRCEDRQVFVPPAIDRVILAEARQRFSKPVTSNSRWLRPWLLWPGLASACAGLALLFYGLVHLQGPGNVVPTFAKEDVNHDGRVDILDAYVLARQ